MTPEVMDLPRVRGRQCGSQLQGADMTLIASPRFLPGVLSIDAASAAASGLLHVAAASTLAGWLGLPSDLLFVSGIALIAVAALAAFAARARPVPRAAVYLLVAVNAAWVA